MGSILLVIHLMTAIFLVALILMQRSGGGALNGLGGGSGANSFLSARGTGNLLTRLTAILATVFFITSIALSIYYKGMNRGAVSVVDSVPATQNVPQVPTVPLEQ
ncbi:MAG: preprotein translocase subunit SecG [Alphaproteobacteria bacterium]|nr:preprotein translocase subunit SecG [Alphaproteobacteria bacterium]